MKLPISYNTKFDCKITDTCNINYNGDYLNCHRVINTKIGNIFTDDFIIAKNICCIDSKTNKAENLYQLESKYKFKGVDLIFSCNCNRSG